MIETSRRIWGVVIVGLVAIGALIWVVTGTSSYGTETSVNDVKSVTVPLAKALTAHDPIYINGNADFATQATSEGWSGDGTEGNPYIIENYDINASQGPVAGIDIRNTDKYFILRDCVIHEGGTSYSGIYFYSVQNGKIDNVTSYNNYDSIELCWYSSNNTITNCAVYNNFNHGIYLFYSSNNNVITNCAIYNNSKDGINQYYPSNNNAITNCVVYNNSWYGIYLPSSSNNTITNCTVYNNYHGMVLDDSSNNNTITNCSVYNNNYYGIKLSQSSNNAIHYCNIYNNIRYGVYNYYTEISYQANATYNWWGSTSGPYHPSSNPDGTGDNVSDNVLYNPWLGEPWIPAYRSRASIYINGNAEFTAENGVSNPSAAGTESDPYLITAWNISAGTAHSIHIENTDKHFIILNCYVHDGGSSYDGIHLNTVQNGTIEYVTSYNNYYGIYLLSSSNNNIYHCNSSSNNKDAIWLGGSSNNTISDSKCISNTAPGTFGINLYASSSNTITNCTLTSNNQGVIVQQNSMDDKIINSTISSNNYDFQFYSDSDMTALNTTFNMVYFNAGSSNMNLTVQWYLNVKVLNSTAAPISGATVRVQDNANGTFDQSYVTDSDGWVRWVECVEYVQNSTLIVYYTPHNVTVTHPQDGYETGYAYPEPTMNESKTLIVTLYRLTSGPVHNLDKDYYYNTIQGAIDEANPGNRISVSPGTYYENVIINKALNLTGENRDTTIIDRTSGDNIYVSADWVNISGFTFKNPSTNSDDACIELRSSNNIVNNCKITGTYVQKGVYIYGVPGYTPSNNKLTNCIADCSGTLIYLWLSINNVIEGCEISQASTAIAFSNANGNSVINSSISNCYRAIASSDASNINIINTTITNSEQYDFNLQNDAQVTALNTSFDKNAVNFQDSTSTLTVQWYLHAKVINVSGSPISSANVRVRDNANGTFDENYTTRSTGWARWTVCTEYVQNSAGSVYYTAHNVSATIGIYKPGYADPEPFMDTSKEVIITVLLDSLLYDFGSGWNLMTLALTPTTAHKASDLLANITNSTTVMRWDAAQWKSYQADDPSFMDFDILDGYGYFVKHTGAEPWDLEGTAIGTLEITIVEGWNLIGWYDTMPCKASDLLANITNSTTVMRWDAAQWKSYQADDPSFMDFDVVQGSGYFVKTTSASTWTHG